MSSVLRQFAERFSSRPAPQTAPGVQIIAFSEADYDCRHKLADDGYPIPPRELWHTGTATFEDWMRTGREHYESMRSLLRSTGFEESGNRRVLDFGCSSGRTVRLWKDEAWAEVWGCEIDAKRLLWCQVNLGDRFRFVQTSMHPHLPFEDRFFDLIYAGSVFTHISEFVDFWLLEICRILKPGGSFFVTIHDERTWELATAGKAPLLKWVTEQPSAKGSRTLPCDFLSAGRDPDSQTFYRSDYFSRKLSRYFDVLLLQQEARGYQTAVIVRKRPLGPG